MEVYGLSAGVVELCPESRRLDTHPRMGQESTHSTVCASIGHAPVAGGSRGRGRESTLTLTDQAQLYEQIAPVVYRRSLALLSDREEALDAVHDVFLVVCEKVDTFRGDSDLLTWVYRIATNHCLNRLRARRSRARALQQYERRPASSASPGAGRVSVDPHAQLERRQLIERLLARFDNRKIQIVVHSYYDEMTQREIATLLGISERAVRKALKRVSDRLTRDGITPDVLREGL